MFKKWKSEYSSCCVAIAQHAGDVVVSGQENGHVLVWDLVGGSLKLVLYTVALCMHLSKAQFVIVGPFQMISGVIIVKSEEKF